MPIYEFKCKNCEHIEEQFLKLKDPLPTKCPACKVDDGLVKIVSQSSFVLKGTGWYETDFKK